MLGNALTIHVAQPRDITDCLRLLRQVYGVDLSGSFEQVVLQYVRDSRAALLLGRLNARSVALATVVRRLSLDHEGLVWQVDCLVVDQEYRRLGIGTAMLRRIVEDASRGACRGVVVDCRVNSAGARAFLQGLGFTPSNRTSYSRAVP